MFAETFPVFIDKGTFEVSSSYNKGALFIVSLLSLVINILVLGYMIYKVIKSKTNPYLGEFYTEIRGYKDIKILAARTNNNSKVLSLNK